MKHLHLLLKPASSLCNMSCRYCFYSDISAARKVPSYGIMSGAITEKIIRNVFIDVNDGDEITFSFQGGEPTLAGLPWFRHFVDYTASQEKKAKVNYAFQTNGLLLDGSWCDFFRKNSFLVGLSIDAGKHFHNRNRIYSINEKNDEKNDEKNNEKNSAALANNSLGNGTFQDCLKAKELLEKNRVEYNILCVLTNDLAKEPDRAWRFIKNENIRYIQFIPCLEPPPSHPAAKEQAGNVLRPALFAKFYSRLLFWWMKELEARNYISVKFFDDVVNYFYKDIATSCGIDGHCHNQYVTEADGSVYPCDFYCFDDYKTGNLAESTMKELFSTEKALSFLEEKPDLPKICGSCKFFMACRGGCKRMRNVMYAGSGDTVCGFRSFLEKCLEPLLLAAKRAFG